MPIFIGILVLCAFFIVFGSKTEEASVIYYDPPGAPLGQPNVGTEAITSDAEAPPEDIPAEVSDEASTKEDAKSMAQSIYDSIDL